MSYNDVTGDKLQSKGLSAQGKDNYDLIFRKKEPLKVCVTQPQRHCDCASWSLGCCGTEGQSDDSID